MKKTMLLMMSVVLTALTTSARTVWTGTQELDWNVSPGKYLQLDAAAVGTINAGDCLVFSYEVTAPDTSWPQFQVCNSSWSKLEGVSLKNGMTSSKVYATPTMAQSLSAGMVISGYGITLSKIELVEGDGGDYSHAVWIGATVIGNWTGYQQVDASAFASAQTGQKLRIKFKDLGAGAYLSLRNPVDGWPDLSGATGTNISGGYHQYDITSAMLTELKSNGMVVSGVNFTCTAVELWNADELKPLTLQVPVTNNWVFTESVPSFTIQVTNPYGEAVTAKAVVEITTDKMAPVTKATNTQEIAAGSSANMAVALNEMPAPGIYHATITVNDDLARGFFFAVKPEQIVSAADKQSDFDSYWAAAKQQLAQVPINATLTEIPSKSGAKRKVYLVEMQSIADGLSGNPVTIRGYYAEPQDGKKHPVLIHYQGYDSEYRPGGDSATPWCINAKYDTDESANYAEFILSNRGQSVNNRPASGRDDGINRDFENIYGDWFAYQFGNKDSYYYRGAYMDCLRAIDFMASRETSDMQNLFAEGQSQGGAFTVAAAALSDRPFNAIAPAITFMGDFPDYFEIVSWPGYVAFNNKGSMTDAEMYAFMSYYDTKNLATSITSPYITSIGLQDNVCPPHTNIAPYNNVQTPASDKQIVYNPELQHATNSKWNDTYMTFFKKYMKDTTGIRSVGSNSVVTDNCYYDLYGRKVVNPQRGIYLVNGRKNIIR